MQDVEKIKKEIHLLLDKGDYTSAKEKIRNEIENANTENVGYGIFLSTIAGLLLDLGAEASDEESVKMGIKILNDNEEYFKSFLSEQSFNYNQGNGIQALYKIQNKDKKLPTLEMIKPNLSNSKNYYFKAFKKINLNEIANIDLQILTNLANNLSESGRIIEAIRLYNSVLRFDPSFPQALIGFASGLDSWIRFSFCPRTIALYLKIFALLQNGLKAEFMPPKQKTYFEKQLKRYEDSLNKNKFDFSTIKKELQLNVEEYEKHSSSRKFYIDKYLALNEHSIYCNCLESSKDDLSIIHEGISLFGDKVGKMELLLNRLKSEFNLARKLYFEGITQSDDLDNIYYSELMDGEIIGEQIEKIRTSFRLCFGIFDKIAHAICYFFDLPMAKNEPIYFNTFWDSQKCPERWDKLRGLRNPHLVALFSIANDFNYKDGEFNFYKQWRNKLEHNNLILVNKTDDPDLFNLFDDDSFVSKVAYTFFDEQALHLLQMCCAAIYSYAYTIRTETMNNADGKPTIPFMIQPKVN